MACAEARWRRRPRRLRRCVRRNRRRRSRPRSERRRRRGRRSPPQQPQGSGAAVTQPLHLRSRRTAGVKRGHRPVQGNAPVAAPRTAARPSQRPASAASWQCAGDGGEAESRWVPLPCAAAVVARRHGARDHQAAASRGTRGNGNVTDVKPDSVEVAAGESWSKAVPAATPDNGGTDGR
ncbi:hypothetical protein D1007_35433 [Hordeum vulgare]|nr:hypothetical protein D1007_35433 [Hordeum vulgare]